MHLKKKLGKSRKNVAFRDNFARVVSYLKYTYEVSDDKVLTSHYLEEEIKKIRCSSNENFTSRTLTISG